MQLHSTVESQKHTLFQSLKLTLGESLFPPTMVRLLQNYIEEGVWNVIFGWKKPPARPRSRKEWAEPLRKLRFFSEGQPSLICFNQVTLPPFIQNLSLQIDPGSWVLLYGEDDFAKALFCDLCFSYILPEEGSVNPGLRGSDVNFLGRSNTTYGKSLLDHLSHGVRENARELMEFAVKYVLSERFRRHISPDTLAFKNGRSIQELELDERDFLEIAEANLLLQRRRAAVIDTTSDFYQIAIEQGFRHSEIFLNSGKTLIWIIDNKRQLPVEAQAWASPAYKELKKLSLYFPNESRVGYVN